MRSARLAAVLALIVLPFAAAAADYPAPKQGQWIARDFKFHTGETMPEVRLAYTTIGEPTGEPVLEPRDVILIKLDGSPKTNDVVVARIPDEGYVVKRVAGMQNGRIELASFNPDYKPIFIDRHRSSILGTVIARFRHE